MFTRIHLACLVLALIMIVVGLCWPGSSQNAAVEVPVAAEVHASPLEPVGEAFEQTSASRDATRIIVSEQLQDEAWQPELLQEKMVIGDQVVPPSVQEKKGLGSSVDE